MTDYICPGDCAECEEAGRTVCVVDGSAIPAEEDECSPTTS